MKTILVSGASGIVGYGILKSIRQASKNLRLVATSIHANTIANYLTNHFELAPLSTNDDYINWLCGIIKKYNIDMIIPGIEIDVSVWNNYRTCISECGAIPLLNNSDLIKLCADKWLFYQELLKNNSEYAIPSSLSDDFEFIVSKYKLPFLVKPRSGSASSNIKKIRNVKEFREIKEKFKDRIMAQPLIGNDEYEYTVSGFFNENSKLLAYQQLQRKLSKDGYTQSARTVKIKNIEKILSDIALIFKPVGPTNFQFRLDEGHMKLLEINPRISSSTSIRTAFGYNETIMSIEYFLNKGKFVPPVLKKGKAVRYIEDFILYEDSFDI